MSNISGLRECWSDVVLNKSKLNVAPGVEVDKVVHLTRSLECHCPLQPNEQCTVIVSEDHVDDVEEIIYLNDSGINELKSEFGLTENAVDLSDNQDTCFDILPDEIIMKILSFIPLKDLYLNVALVCKSWKDFALSPVLWQHLDSADTKLLTSQCLTNIICKHCSLLKSLDLRYKDELHCDEILAIAKACPLLKKLTLSFCAEVQRTLKVFVNHCPSLQHLILEGCDITDNCLEHLATLPLEGLNVSHCIHLTDEGLKMISSRCNNLRVINFDGVQWITDKAVFVMVDNCSHVLEKLFLDGDNLTDASVKAISKCKNLKVFSLSFCDNLTDDSLTWIQHMKKLYSLRLKKGVGFSATALAELFVQLDIHLMENLSGILFLSLPECSTLNDDAVQAIAHSCPYLITLNLSWCWDITDCGLRHVIVNCSKMERLIIIGLTDIVGDCLLELPQYMPHLIYLDASQCNTMSDNILVDLVNTVPKITVLDYYSEIIQPRFLKGHLDQHG